MAQGDFDFLATANPDYTPSSISKEEFNGMYSLTESGKKDLLAQKALEKQERFGLNTKQFDYDPLQDPYGIKALQAKKQAAQSIGLDSSVFDDMSAVEAIGVAQKRLRDEEYLNRDAAGLDPEFKPESQWGNEEVFLRETYDDPVARDIERQKMNYVSDTQKAEEGTFENMAAALGLGAGRIVNSMFSGLGEMDNAVGHAFQQASIGTNEFVKDMEAKYNRDSMSSKEAALSERLNSSLANDDYFGFIGEALSFGLDPTNIANYVVENIPEIAASVNPITATARISALINDNLNESKQAYIEQNGKPPEGSEDYQRQALSVASGIADFFGDRLVGKRFTENFKTLYKATPNSVKAATKPMVQRAVSIAEAGVGEFAAESSAYALQQAAKNERIDPVEATMQGIAGLGAGVGISGTGEALAATASGSLKKEAKDTAKAARDAAVMRKAPEELKAEANTTNEAITELQGFSSKEDLSEKDLDSISDIVEESTKRLEELEDQRVDLIEQFDAAEEGSQEKKDLGNKLEAIATVISQMEGIQSESAVAITKTKEAQAIAVIDSLEEVLGSLDKESDPERYNAIENQLNQQKKVLSESSASKERIDAIRRAIRANGAFGSSSTVFNENSSEDDGSENATLNGVNFEGTDKEVYNSSIEDVDSMQFANSKVNQRAAASKNAVSSKATRKAVKDDDLSTLSYLKKQLESRLEKTKNPNDKNVSGKNVDAEFYPNDIPRIEKLLEPIYKYEADNQVNLSEFSGKETALTKEVRDSFSSIAAQQKSTKAENRLIKNNKKISKASEEAQRKGKVGAYKGGKKSKKNKGTTNQGFGKNTYSDNSVAVEQSPNRVSENNANVNAALDSLDRSVDTDGTSKKIMSTFVDPTSGASVESFSLSFGKSNRTGSKFIKGLQDLPRGFTQLVSNLGKSNTKILRVTKDGMGFQKGDIIFGAHLGIVNGEPKLSPISTDDKSRFVGNDTYKDVVYAVLRHGEVQYIKPDITEAKYAENVASFEESLKEHNVQTKKKRDADTAKREEEQSTRLKIGGIAKQLTRLLQLNDANAVKELLVASDLLKEDASKESLRKVLSDNYLRIVKASQTKQSAITRLQEELKTDKYRDDPKRTEQLATLKLELDQALSAISAYESFININFKEDNFAKPFKPVKNSRKSNTFIGNVFDIIENFSANTNSLVNRVFTKFNKKTLDISTAGHILVDPVKGPAFLKKIVAENLGIKRSELSSEQIMAINSFHTFATEFHNVLSERALSFNEAIGTGNKKKGKILNVWGLLDLDKYPIGLLGTTVGGTPDASGRATKAPAQVDPSISFTMALSSIDWLNSLPTNTVDNIKDSMGADNVDMNNPAHRAVFKKYRGKVVGKKGARDIGVQAARAMGITFDPNSPNNIQEELYSSIGALALSTMAEMRGTKGNALVNLTSVSINEFRADRATLMGHRANDVEIDSNKKVPLVNKGFRDVSDNITNHMDLLTDSLGVLSSKRYPTTDKSKAIWKKDRGYLKYLELPEHTVAEDLTKVGWQIDSTLAQIALEPDGREQLFKLFYDGDLSNIDIKELDYKTIKAIANQHTPDMREKVEFEIDGLIQEIDNAIDGIKHVAQSNPDFTKPVYLSYFSVGQGRFQILTNTLDPQQSKVVRRLLKPDFSSNKLRDKLVMSKDSLPDYYYDLLGSLVGLSEKNYLNSKDDYRDYFKKLLQSLDYSALSSALAEPLSKESLQTMADILNNTVVEGDFKPKKFKPTDAYIVAKELVALNQGDKIISGIAAEVDSITSNFAITLFQYPVFQGLYDHLDRVGIFVNEQDTAHGVLGKQGFKDSYVAMGEHLAGNVFKHLNGLKSSDISKFGLPKSSVGLKNLGLANSFGEILAYFGDANADLSQGVAAAVRDIFKYPFMTVNYLSGKTATVELARNSILSLVHKRIDDLSQGEPTREELIERLSLFDSQFEILNLGFTYGKSGKSTNVRQVLSALEKENITTQQAINALKSFKLKDSKDTSFSQFMDVVSKAVTDSAFDVLGESLDKRRLVNSTFHIQYEVYIAALREAIPDPSKVPHTIENINKAVDSVRHLLPSFEGPKNDKSSETQRYPAFKVKAVTAAPKVDTARKLEGESKTSVQVEFAFQNGNKSLTVALNSRDIQDVGVGSQALMTQSLESTIMALTAQESVENVLHVHDATKGHPILLALSGLYLNEMFYKESRDYDMVGDALESMGRSLEAAHKIGALGSNKDKIFDNSVAVQIVANAMSTRVEDPNIKSFDFDKYLRLVPEGDYQAAAKLYLQDLNELHSFTTAMRNTLFPHVDDQGNIVDGQVKAVDNFTGPVEGTTYKVDQSQPAKNRVLNTVVYGDPSKVVKTSDGRVKVQEAVNSKLNRSKKLQKIEISEEKSQELMGVFDTIKTKFLQLFEASTGKLLFDVESNKSQVDSFNNEQSSFKDELIPYKGQNITLKELATKKNYAQNIVNAFIEHLIQNNRPMYLLLVQTDLANSLEFTAKDLDLTPVQVESINQYFKSKYGVDGSGININLRKPPEEIQKYLMDQSTSKLAAYKNKLQKDLIKLEEDKKKYPQTNPFKEADIKSKIAEVDTALQAKRGDNANKLDAVLANSTVPSLEFSLMDTLRYMTLTNANVRAAKNIFNGLHTFIDGVSTLEEAQRVRNTLTDILKGLKGSSKDSAVIARSEITKAIKTIDYKFSTAQVKETFKALAANNNKDQITAFVSSLNNSVDRNAVIEFIDNTGLTEQEKNDLRAIVNVKNQNFGSDPNTLTIQELEDIISDGTNHMEITEDSVMDTFDKVTATDNTEISKEHHSYLANLVGTLVRKGLKRIGKVDSFIGSLDNKVNSGAYNPESQSLFLNAGSYKGPLDMSQREIFGHELVHAISLALFNDPSAVSKAMHFRDTFLKQYDKNTIIKALMGEETGQEAYNIAKQRYEYMFENSDTLNDIPVGLAEFISYSLTNEGMVNLGKQVKVKDPITDKIKGDSLAEKMLNWLVESMIKLFDSVIGNTEKASMNVSVHRAMYNLVSSVQETNETANRTAVGKLAKPVFNALNAVSERQNKINDTMVQKLDETFNSTVSHLVENLRSTLKKANSVPNGITAAVFANSMGKAIAAVKGLSPEKELQLITMLSKKLQEDGSGLTQTYMSQIIDAVASLGDGKLDIDTTSNIRTLLESLMPSDVMHDYEMMHRKFKHEVEGVATTKEEAGKEAVRESAAKEKTKDEEKQVTKLLIRSDMFSLLKYMNFDTIKKHIFNTGYRKSTISSIRAEILTELEATPDVAKAILAQANGLAEFMVDSGNVGFNQMRSAETVVKNNVYPEHLMNSNARARAIAGREAKLIELVDKYASLMAYDILSTKAYTKQGMDALRAENEAKSSYIETILRQAYAADQYSRENLFKDNEVLMVKGHIPFRSEENLEFREGTAEQVNLMAKEGFVKLFNPQDGIVTYVRPLSRHGSISMGMFTGIPDESSGKSVISRQLEFFGGDSEKMLEDLYKQQSELAYREQVLGIKDEDNRASVVPIYDNNGVIVDYNNTVSNYAKEKLLGQTMEVSKVVGAMHGSTHRKAARRIDIQDTVDFIVDDYARNKDSDPTAFIRINSNPYDRFGRPNPYADMARLMGDEYKDAFRAKGINLNKGIPVRKATVNALFGFKKMSAVNTIPVKALQEMFPDKPIRKWFLEADDLIKEFTSIRKVQIVLKEPAVIVGNFISAFTLNAMYGVNSEDITKHMRQGFKEINAYKKYVKDLTNVDAMLVSKPNDKKLLQRRAEIQKLMNGLEIMELIDQGMYSMMAEDIDVNDSGLFQEKLDQIRNKNVVTKGVGKAVDVAYMTKGTPMFQMLSNLTQYTDFAGRFVLYKHLKKEGKLSDKEIFKKVSNAFVYYDMPDGRILEGMNSYGLIMFSKFHVRTQRVLLDLLKEKPLNVASQGIVELMLFDVENILNQFFFNKHYGAMFNLPTEHIMNTFEPPMFAWLRYLNLM